MTTKRLIALPIQTDNAGAFCAQACRYYYRKGPGLASCRIFGKLDGAVQPFLRFTRHVRCVENEAVPPSFEQISAGFAPVPRARARRSEDPTIELCTRCARPILCGCSR